MSIEPLTLGSASRSRLLDHLVRLAAPVVLASIAQTLMGLVDTLMVARLGTAAIAAVGVSTLLFSAMATSIKSLDVAVQTFTARRDGAGRERETGAVVGTGLAMVAVAGIFGTVAGVAWPGLGLGLVSADPEVVALGSDYYRLRAVGLLPLLVFLIIRSGFDGLGHTRVGMVVGVGMNLVNVLLNWMLIFGKLGAPALGVQGAALASTIAAVVAAVAMAALALRPRMRRQYGWFDRGFVRRDLVRPLWRTGWPPALQALGLIGGIVAFYGILGHISTVAVAAGNIVMRMASLAIMPTIGVGVAVQTLVSRCLGARDARGAWRSGLAGVVLAATLMIALGLPYLLIPDQLLGAFTPEPSVLAAGRAILRITALGQVLAAAGLTFAGVLRGAGDTGRVLAVDVGTGAGFMLPAAWILGMGLGGGLLGAWWALAAWFALHAAVMTGLFVGKRWLRFRL